MKYSTEYKEVARTGKASFGWHLGHGFIVRTTTIKLKRHCIVLNNAVIADCRSEAIAKQIVDALNKE